MKNFHTDNLANKESQPFQVNGSGTGGFFFPALEIGSAKAFSNVQYSQSHERATGYSTHPVLQATSSLFFQPQTFSGPVVQKKPNGSGNIQESASVLSSTEKNRKAQDESAPEQLSAESGQGVALPAATRHYLESRFRADFSGVRVHHSAADAALAAKANAQAFTYGNDIYFNQGKYAPASREGLRLLSHELTHVVQQSKAQASAPAPLPTTALEKEANNTANAILNNAGPVSVQGAGGKGMARQAISLFSNVPPESLSNEDVEREIDLCRQWLRTNSILHNDYEQVHATLTNLEAVLHSREARRASPASPRAPSAEMTEQRRLQSERERHAQFGGLTDAGLESEIRSIRAMNRSSPVAQERLQALENEVAIRTREQSEDAVRERQMDDLEAQTEALLHQMQDAELSGMIEVRRRFPLLRMAEQTGSPLAQIAEFSIGLVPVVGTIAGLYEAITGRTLLLQEQISDGFRLTGGLLSIIPVAGPIIRRGRAAAPYVAAIVRVARGRVQQSPRQVIRMMVGMDHLSQHQAFLRRAIEQVSHGGPVGPEQERALALILSEIGEDSLHLQRAAHHADMARNLRFMAQTGRALSNAEMIRYLQPILANPVVRDVFRIAREARGQELVERSLHEIIPAFRRRTGIMEVILSPGDAGYNNLVTRSGGLNITIGQGVANQMRIPAALLNDPEAFFRELTHDIFSYLSSGREFRPPRDMPFVPNAANFGNPEYWHAGRMLDNLLSSYRAGESGSIEALLR